MAAPKEFHGCHALTALFPSVYPRLDREDDGTFEKRERAFFTRGIPPRPTAQATSKQLATFAER
jgi:hypothetical protein